MTYQSRLISGMETTAELQRQYVRAKRRVRRDLISTRAIEASLLAQNSDVVLPGSLFENSVHDYILEFLLQFDSDAIMDELLRISPHAERSMNQDLFVDVVRVISHHRIDVNTATQIFTLEEGDKRWERLARRIVHRLRLLFLAEKLHSCGLFSRPVSRTLTAKTSPRKVPTKPSPPTIHTARPKKLKPKRSLRTGSVHSLTSGLERSGRQLRAIELSQTDIMVVAAQTVGVSQFPSAISFSKNIALRKLLGLCKSKAQRLLFEAWTHWRQHCKLAQVLNGIVIPAVKMIAAERVFLHMLRNSRRTIHRALLRMWSWIRLCRFREYSAAAVELQRGLRGFICRQKLKFQRSAYTIQNLIRISRLKSIFHRMYFSARASRSSRLIQAWFRKIWNLRQLNRRFKRKKRILCATIIQRYFRGWRSRCDTNLVVDFVRNRISAVVRLQSWARGQRQRNKFNQLRLNAITIQRFWLLQIHRRRLVHKKNYIEWTRSRESARKILMRKGERRIEEVAARKIVLAMKAFTSRKAQIISVELPESWASNHRLRFNRCLAAIRIRGLLCCIMLRRKQLLEISKIRNARIMMERRKDGAVITIQRIFRGHRGRKNANARKSDYEKAQAKRFRNVPFYYRIQESYLQTQNMMHRRQVVQIQAMYRAHIAKKLFQLKKRFAAAELIALKIQGYRKIAKAKRILVKKRADYQQMINKVVTTQRVVRGWLARRLRWMITAVRIMLRFSLCNHRAKLIFQIVKEHKNRLKYQIRMLQSVIKIQSVGRRYLARLLFLKSYRKLLKSKANRDNAQKLKARIKIQSVVRGFLARVRVKKRREEYLQKQRKLKEDASLEAELDALHEGFLNDLQVVKLQNTVRKHLSKKLDIRFIIV